MEATSYRTVQPPSNMNVPEYTSEVFTDFYKDMFANTVKKNDMRAVITEHAWDMSWCDPCAADPLSATELKSLGVWWIDEAPEMGPTPRPVPPGRRAPRGRMRD